MTNADTESRWLLRAIGDGLYAVCVGVAVLALVLGWPASTMGNVFQLIGLMIAGLGVPILSPALGRVELHAGTAKVAVARWMVTTRATLKRRLARLFRRRKDANISAPAVVGTTSGTGGGALALTVRDNPAKVPERELLVRHDREIVELRGQVDALERTQAKDRAATGHAIDALRTELQEHVLSITREGWHYIVGGASVTAVGIVVALFG